MLFKVFAPLAFAALSFAAAISNPSMMKEGSQMAARQFPDGTGSVKPVAPGSPSQDSGKQTDGGIGPIFLGGDEGDNGNEGGDYGTENGSGNGSDNASAGFGGW
ncbi:hypothetical protein DTO027B5_1946 [Paecilomyces variotii]|nr:hypothetical protein DTO169C6_958 [Paecilomyces variotii]KAJ9271555.1 hypothetical protein DTO212C5_2347 [Paecilomyces variotii]KAJ9327558.1 hypothetical protein DTO027B3_1780 [Paecilomyces variotii]KAJ9336265.1 hypothetical protein DTO027B5_1946 [Paecilomyces variotii]